MRIPAARSYTHLSPSYTQPSSTSARARSASHSVVVETAARLAGIAIVGLSAVSSVADAGHLVVLASGLVGLDNRAALEVKVVMPCLRKLLVDVGRGFGHGIGLDPG